MQSKSIFSLISFCLNSMFFVPSASAGPTHVNIVVAQACGEVRATQSRTCNLRSLASGNRKGVRGWEGSIACDGVDTRTSVSGSGSFTLKTAKCGQVGINTLTVDLTVPCVLNPIGCAIAEASGDNVTISHITMISDGKGKVTPRSRSKTNNTFNVVFHNPKCPPGRVYAGGVCPDEGGVSRHGPTRVV